MGKIEMDLSEYDKMMENKRLLEESNRKLETAYKDNAKLQQEKVDALKANENTVTIVEKKSTYEMAHHPRPEHEIMERMERLGIPLHNLHRSRHGSVSITSESITKLLLGELYDFRQSVSSQDEKEVIYSESLETFKSNFKKEAEESLDADVKLKLSKAEDQADIIKKLNAELKKFKKSSKEEVEILEEIITKHIDNIKELEEKIPEEGTISEKSLIKLIQYVDQETRFIPVFKGKEICKKVSTKCVKFMSKNKIERL